MTVPGDATGGGTGLSDRNRGCICASALLSRPVRDCVTVLSELVSEPGDPIGVWIGESGR